MSDVANFCNAFPNVEMTFEVQDPDDVTASDPVSVIVTLEREDDEQEPDEGWGKVGWMKVHKRSLFLLTFGFLWSLSRSTKAA